MDLLAVVELANALKPLIEALEWSDDSLTREVTVELDTLRDLSQLAAGKIYIDLVPIDTQEAMTEESPDRSHRTKTYVEASLLISIRQKSQGKPSEQKTLLLARMADARMISNLLKAKARGGVAVSGQNSWHWKDGSNFISREDLRVNSLVSIVWPDVTFYRRSVVGS